MYTVATTYGNKWHYSADGQTTLCGRVVSNGTDEQGEGCKTCLKRNPTVERTEDIVVSQTPAGVTASPRSNVQGYVCGDCDTTFDRLAGLTSHHCSPKAVESFPDTAPAQATAKNDITPETRDKWLADGSDIGIGDNGPTTQENVIPDRLIHLMHHANGKKNRDMWKSICIRKYGRKAVERVL